MHSRLTIQHWAFYGNFQEKPHHDGLNSDDFLKKLRRRRCVLVHFSGFAESSPLLESLLNCAPSVSSLDRRHKRLDSSLPIRVRNGDVRQRLHLFGVP